mmetsp:Transcript_20633/g.56974  ORF Transcript_20633/g.56974 Transcript_20633/m.56974 type:complete len:1282 (-) Transcript_20633:2036-5881(-)
MSDVKGVNTAIGEPPESNAPSNVDNATTTTITKNEKPLQQASFRQLFSFATTRRTRFLIALSFLCAAVSGMAFPAMAYIFALVFADLSADTASNEDFLESIRNMAFTFCVLGLILFVSMTAQTTFMESAAVSMTHTMQRQWFEALMRQDMAYHDIRDSTGEATLITVNGNKYRKGVGKKMAAGFQYVITFFGGMAYSFAASWQNSLVMLSVSPLIALSALFLVQMNTSQSARANASYAKAGSIVATAIRNIRTISALNAIPRVIENYADATLDAQKGALGQVWLVGLATGSQMASLIISFLVVTLFGTWLLYDNVQDSGCDPSDTVSGVPTCDPSSIDILGSLFGVFIAASVAPQVSVSVEALAKARIAVYPALCAIERTSKKQNGSAAAATDGSKGNVGDDDEDTSHAVVRRGGSAELPPFLIDSGSDDEGLKPESVTGDIVFDHVLFSYPTRLEQKVFSEFSLEIKAGTTLALVGPSGQGKSTIVSLLERFYDPLEGHISLDGNDLKDLNVKWLRQHVGLVSQEPKLFNMSVGENIASGAVGRDVSQKDIEDAARRANAHDFIMGFPKGYQTQVGDLGGQLSGGQRQRIAIARVLIKQPKILLLDEATSALDSESEATVQKALDSLMESSNMTIIAIAHRLSTIKNSEKIAVVNNGRVEESGTHNELVAKQGLYYTLVQTQQLGPGEKPPAPARQETDVSSEFGGEIKSERDVVIQLEDVSFTYPARPDTSIFKGLNLSARRGETLALCGPSGQGKSSVIQLIERFYDPDEGRVIYNGDDIKDLNVAWYRDQLGLVSQEPNLFDCSVRENICYGSPDATMDQIVQAAKLANAHSFITEFPDGYDTDVGAGSSLLISGGQKQRICIARALLKRPKVLLLDEATSALDSESERIVQEALDALMNDSSEERTTIVIAHRLSTIQNAERIAVIDKGRVREIGTHDELMAKDGRYARLVNLQDLGSSTLVDSSPYVSKTDAPEPSSMKEVHTEDQVEEDEEEDKDHDKEQAKKDASRARGLAIQERQYFFYGAIGAVFAGVVFPGWGIAFGYMIEVLYTNVAFCSDENPISPFDNCQDYYDFVADDMRDRARKISYSYLGLGLSVMFGSALLYWGMGNATERINKTIRDMTFKNVIRQDIAWFDLRNPNALTTQLAEDAAMLHSFAGEPIRSIVLAVAGVLVGVIVSFIYMWPFALLTLATIPFMAFGAEMEMAMYYGEDEGDDHQMEEDCALESERSSAIFSSFKAGSAAGLGQFVQMWGYALMFWWGGWLLVNTSKFSFLGK